MKLSTVSARNFLGLVFDYDLGPVTIITGPNGSGKTAIPKAIRLALAGYLPPPIGTKGIYRLAGAPNSAGEMSVLLQFDNGRKVGLKWVRNNKGTVSTDGGIPADLVMPPLLLEPRMFFAQTAADQIKTIFDSCPGAGAELPDKIRAGLDTIQVNPVRLRNEILEKVQTWIDDAFDDCPPQTGAAKLLEKVKTETKAAADSAKFLSNQITAFQLPVSKPVDVTKELESARKALAELEVTQRQSANSSAQRSQEISNTLAAYSRKYKETPPEHLVEFINSELQTIAKDLRRLPVAPPIDDVQEELEDTALEQRAVQDNLIKYQAEVERLQKLIGDLEIAVECPTCKAKSAGWKKRALESLNAELKVSQDAAANWTAKRSTADATITRLKLTIESARKSADDSANRRTELESEADAYITDRDAIASLLREQQGLTTTPQTEAPDVSKADSLRQKIGQLSERQAARAAYNDNLKRREQLETDLVAAQASADVLKAVTKIVTQETAASTEQAFTSVLSVARHFTDGILNSPIEFVDGELGRRASKFDAKPGFIAPLGSWISHETFSDSEQRIAYAAFAVALAASAPIKLVVIDEMGTLQRDKKILFVDRLVSLVHRGIIDQAICLEPESADYAAFAAEKNIKLIRLQYEPAIQPASGRIVARS